MRQRVNGVATAFPGLISVLINPIVTLLQSGQRVPLDAASGEWGGLDTSLRYADDTFVLPMTAPTAGDSLALEVDVQDMAAMNLDSNPASPVDWVAGAWSAWEDASGQAGDIGGPDSQSAALSVSATVAATGVTLESSSALSGEGDELLLRLQRPAESAQGVVFLQGRLAGGEPVPLLWNDGVSGSRLMRLPVADDLEVQGDRDLAFSIDAIVDSQPQPLFSGTTRVLDNDRPGKLVLRTRSSAYADLARLTGIEAGERELVADGGRDYRGPSNLLTFCQQFEFEAPLRVFGNRSRWLPGDSACTVSQLSGSGRVELRDLTLDGRRENGQRIPLLQGNEATLALHRVVMQQAEGFALATSGALELRQSALIDSNLDRLGRSGDFALIESASADVQNLSALNLTVSASDESLQAAVLGFSGAAESSVRQFSTSDELSSDFRIRGNTVLRSSLVLSEQVPVIGPVPICSGVRSGGFNVSLTSHCFEPVASDLTGVGVGASVRAGADLAYKLPRAQAIDHGGSCAGVDQRGAPRPQSSAAGAEAVCDAGAVELGLNPWRGFWIPTRAGHGIDMQTRDNVLFLLWYSYNDQGQPTAYQAAAPLSGPQWNARLKLASRDPQSGQVSLTEVGDIGINFASDTAAELSWKFDARSSGGSEAISAFAFASGEPRVELTGTWFPPSADGYGARISRRGEVTAIAIYYYDASGQLRWALGASDAQDASRFAMSSYTGFCPDCSAVSMPVQLTSAGSVDLHALTPLRLRLDGQLSYPGTEGGTWQPQMLELVPISDPVDNREAAAQSATRH